MKILAYYLFRLFVYVIGILSENQLYKLSRGLKFLVFSILKYRVSVSRTNLIISFPDKSETEITNLLNSYYQNLCDIILETIHSYTHTGKIIQETRFKFVNPEILQPYIAQKQKLVAVAAHIGNFEIGAISLPSQLKMNIYSVFKPLANKKINEYILQQRLRTGLNLSPLKGLREMLKTMQAGSMLILVSDQNPSNIEKAHWVDFLHQDTAFIHGPTQITQEMNAPLFYIHIRRIQRGRYEGIFELITNTPTDFTPQELTQKIATFVEKNIQDQPNDWLWSHKRWKWVRKGGKVVRV